LGALKHGLNLCDRFQSYKITWAIHLNALICFGLLVLIASDYCHNNHKDFFLINSLHLPNIYPIKLENSKKDLFSQVRKHIFRE
jgi:hypothetical protein